MSVFEHTSFAGHESVHFFNDSESGLRAIIGVHSTARGPAAGGCRMYPYQDAAAALTDVLRLSEGMSYKNAVADLDLGGGKAVIIGDPRRDKSERLFESFGRAVQSIGGTYYTAEDVGISPDDMRLVRRQTRFVAGLNEGEAASGDPSPVTARGVYLGIKAAAFRVFGSDDLSRKRIAVQGVGHVGAYLCDYLAEAGADLVIADVDQAACARVAAKTGAKISHPSEIMRQNVDIFSPNALGAILNSDSVRGLHAKIVAGGANNQLAEPQIGEELRAKGVLYAPDFVINGGGIINVAAEIRGNYDRIWVEEKLQTLVGTLESVLDRALSEQKPTHEIALSLAKSRIDARKKPREMTSIAA